MLDSKRNEIRPGSGNVASTGASINKTVNSVSRIKSAELFRRANEIEIDHEGRIYRLRLTQFNKLILTA